MATTLLQQERFDDGRRVARSAGRGRAHAPQPPSRVTGSTSCRRSLTAPREVGIHDPSCAERRRSQKRAVARCPRTASRQAAKKYAQRSPSRSLTEALSWHAATSARRSETASSCPRLTGRRPASARSSRTSRRRWTAVDSRSSGSSVRRSSWRRTFSPTATTRSARRSRGHATTTTGTGRPQEMEPLGNDRWRASFALKEIGRYQYTVTGWVDHWRTWVHDLQKRVDAGQDVTVDLQIGAQIVEAAAGRATGRGPADVDARRREPDRDAGARPEARPRSSSRYPDLTWATTLDEPLVVVVDPVRARFSAWYELFPRSASPDPKRHGTFDDVDRAPRLRRRPGLRRAVPAAHLADRPPVPQGPEQHGVAQAQPTPASRGRSAVRPAVIRRCTRSSATSPTSIGWSTAARQTQASRSRSTSLSRPRPTTRG